MSEIASMKTIVGYPNYGVTQTGDVVNFRTGRVLKKVLTAYGYHQVYLSNDFGRKMFLVHRLVMAAFVGSSELGVNHINGNKTDNRLENLEYVTAKENMKHSIEVLGNSTAGVRHGRCKLTQQQVDDIRVERAAGESQRSIAKRYNISWSSVSKICLRKRHK